MIRWLTMRQAVWRFSLLVAAFAGGATASSWANAARGDGDDTYRSLATFARVLNYVENNYVNVIPAEDLIYGAIRGMLATLDPHSAFLDPDQYAALRSEAQGEFGGIGVELVKGVAGIRIVERHDNSPALKAGLRIGDVIIAVDDVPTAGQSLAEVVRRIKGPFGTSVQLTVKRQRDGRVEPVDLIREPIRVVSVGARRLDERLGYIRIRSFSERTSADLADALARLKQDGELVGLVLDLRDNPGGLLLEAVRVADTWLAKGTIVSTEGRRRPPDQKMAHPKGTEPPYPVVVLVNGGTASAAEIVAGALQDHRRAVVLGTQTFGKGSVQTVIELEDRSALKLTIARYFTPSHRSITGVGITPDVVVPRQALGAHVAEPKPSDRQLDAAVADLRRRRTTR